MIHGLSFEGIAYERFLQIPDTWQSRPFAEKHHDIWPCQNQTLILP